ncbi:MAG: hypothetical protein V1754_04465, partial [Pseudomonadota bacterium]
MKLLVRDPASLVMLFVLPAVFIVTLSVALQGAFSSEGSKEKIDVLVVDEDEGEIGEKIVKGLEGAGFFRAVEDVGEQTIDRKGAIKKIHNGEYQVAVIVPKGSTAAAGFDGECAVEILV